MQRFCILLCLFILACAKTNITATHNSAEQAIQYKILSRWIVPKLPGHHDPVSMEVYINREGVVENIKLANQQKYNLDKNYKLLADSASKAIYKASPFEGLLPSEYDKWKVIYITFNPN